MLKGKDNILWDLKQTDRKLLSLEAKFLLRWAWLTNHPIEPIQKFQDMHHLWMLCPARKCPQPTTHNSHQNHKHTWPSWAVLLRMEHDISQEDTIHRNARSKEWQSICLLLYLHSRYSLKGTSDAWWSAKPEVGWSRRCRCYDDHNTHCLIEALLTSSLVVNKEWVPTMHRGSSQWRHLFVFANKVSWETNAETATPACFKVFSV